MDMRRRGLELVTELVGVFKLALDQANRAVPDALVTGSLGQGSHEVDVAAGPAAGGAPVADSGENLMRLAALPLDVPDVATPDMPDRNPPARDQFAGPATARAIPTDVPALVYQALGSGAASEVTGGLQIDGMARIEAVMPVGVVPFSTRQLPESGEDNAALAMALRRQVSDAVTVVTINPEEAPTQADLPSQVEPPAVPALAPVPLPEVPAGVPPTGLADAPTPPAIAEPPVVIEPPAVAGPIAEPEPAVKPELEPVPDDLPQVIVIDGHEFYGTERGDHIIATSGNDFLSGHDGNDTLDGAGGYNTVGYWRDGGKAGAQIDLATGTATGTYGDHDTLINIQNIRGSEQDDVILGDALGNFLRGAEGDDLIDGRMGDDALFGEAGDDTLAGGAGRETLVGGQGADLIDGGAGYDLLDYSLDGGAVGISVNLKTGFIIDTWGDLDVASNIEGLRATDRDDFIRLSDNGVRVELGRGDDWVFGGAGSDVFVFGREIGIFGPDTGRDRVNDFDILLDTLDLSAAGYESFDDVLANAVGIDLGVMLDDGHGNVITLVDVNISQLGQLNYVFG